MTNLYTTLAERFRKKKQQSFLLLPSGETISYGEIDEKSAELAAYLLQEYSPQQRMLVVASKSVEFLILYLAALRAGMIFVPINPACSAEEINYFINDCDPSLIVTDNNLFEKINANTTVIELASLIEKAQAENQQAEVIDNAKIAVIIYTSGTTGKPKGAMLSHKNLIVNAVALTNLWQFNSDDVLLHMLPLFHVHGLFFATHCTMLAAAKMWFLPKFDVEQAIELLPQSTVMMGVPTYYTRLLQQQKLNKKLCTNMRLFISGSAPLLPQTFTAFYNASGHEIVERYGMSEAGVISSNPINNNKKIGTVGVAVADTKIKIIAEDKDKATAAIGEIQIKGEGIFLGYWNKPQQTEDALTKDGYFKTGDLGCFDESNYLKIVGRAKDMIITGGLNVYPKEIELMLDSIPGVEESAVVGVADADFGEKVIAFVIATGIDEATIIAAAKAKLANYKVPKKVFLMEQLPRNSMGKVQKNILRQLAL